MALRPIPTPFSVCSSRTHFRNLSFFNTKSRFLENQWPTKDKSSNLHGKRTPGRMVKACVSLEERNPPETGSEWGKVSAVLFDMDGVLCNSEELSRLAAVDVFAEMGVEVTVEDFVPFMGTGEANFLGGVASVKGVKGFNPESAKKRFFEIYLDKYAKPNSGIGFPGAYELIVQCKNKGLKVAVASSADRIKVDANLAAAGLQLSMFDAIVSADAFENLKPAPDIFLAASKILDVPTNECLVIEDALAGVQAAKSARMRCIAVTTTLAEDTLRSAGPSLIRKEIGDISLDDILNGGSDSPNPERQPSQNSSTTTQSLSYLYSKETEAFEGKDSMADPVFSFGGFQGSRRNILRYGSLGIALSCLYFTFTNRKAMQYASPKAIWNLLFGAGNPSFGPKKEESRNDRVQQFVNYISDLEKRGTATTVPEFPSKLDWLNTAPLQLQRDLKGKVVILDFWTYCCINCMHVLPDLEFLERKYKDAPFVVVGVHSAKFDNEKDLEAIRNAVLRYGITHPVVNDGDMYLWRELGINSWPTFALVGPNGKLLAQVSGEGRRKDLDDLVEAALLYYGSKKILDNRPLLLNLEKDNDPRLLTSPLKFPGKLEVDVLNNRLFISDSNHNRVVVTDIDGNFKMQIGSTGEEGFRDGNFDDAMFNRPQGLAYNAKKNLLYVADTENHALRVIDFVNETVQTLAGNGTKGSDYQGGGSGTSQLLNSPWDVCFDPVKEIVYIAMAGQHQIWTHTPDGTTKAFSGDGYERNLNGSSSGSTSFAQPSGISLSPDLKEAYIADSESSSIRALDLSTGGSRLLVGGDPVFSDNLFKFGDHDGVGSEVLLQHPLGVFCGSDGHIYLADSYNHKIKKLDLASKTVTTLAGTGKAGFKDGPVLEAQLSEPSGLVEAGNGRLLIADTNNSVIRFLDLNKKEPALLTLELKGVQPPTPKSKSPRRLRRRSTTDTKTIVIDGGSINEGQLRLEIRVLEGYHFSKEAQSKFSVEVEPEDAAVVDPMDGNISPEGSAILHFKRSSPSPSKSRIFCKVYYCKEDEVCLYQPLMFEVSFQEAAPSAATAEIPLQYVVKPKSDTYNLQATLAR
ncbi:protein SUPPRESSOR OF QUENCHING 1, chloroplastic isoform X2 [Salvia miltiorrhiza]|uniref:protein SUPPRESSOR OF QUENCHING 1, chloroplastic isoform X2 n=1 Tax=Salvia miltiorrhiza TaxID=226208 RepID=UPI0025AC6F50|nr:protein SUPPRESSOR OF QUENCHING 1, chloroplastic isoform X2 [Salvia miltiorrhiza]